MLSLDTIKHVVSEAMRNGCDLAEVYLEDRKTLTLRLDDGSIEEAIRGSDTGAGVRIFYGDTAAYAYTDDLSEPALLQAAQAASAAAKGSNEPRIAVDLTQRRSNSDSPIERPFSSMSTEQKATILREMDAAARDFSPLVSQVGANYQETERRVWIYNSDGVWAEDDRNILEFRVNVTAQQGDVRQRAVAGFGGQIGMELIDANDPVAMARDQAAGAVQMLEAKPAPAGEMTVVVSNGWGGVLFHEACGHAMEADFVTKGASAYTGQVGEQIANPILSTVDDGTIPGRRGTLRFDDEGTPTQRTVLIENGILREYMWDLTEARRAGRASTGNGRRQSFRHMPMPRMTNTFIDVGPHDPQEIIESVEYGLLCKRMGGGQADIARGDFVFTVTEGWMIEKGKLTYPVRGATLVGNGPAVLKQIDMVGTDLALDPGMGMCGKMQSARVSVGQPTVRIPKLTVGGTDKDVEGAMGV
ncbi:TldD/PmbA family protein [Chloroflexi bacterium TSY]|nr:TldD/PmbA family protein [Chloroflexi bacterium TSY]